MYKLEVTLKQHTPLIHFQHDQEGATLRASEVKPKLDRFILTKLGEGNYEAGKSITGNKDWIKAKGALDYKMKISIDQNATLAEYMIVSYIKEKDKQSLEKNNINIITNSPYFAQEEKTKSIIQDIKEWDIIEKKGILYNNIILEIIGYDEILLKYISEIIQSFFLVNNFGTRKSKGFGCFEVINCSLNGDIISIENNEELLKKYYKFVYKKQLNNSDLQNIFQQINSDYKLIKSGRTRPYAKSKLMLYGLKENHRWDKAFIKNKTDAVYETPDKNEYFLKDDHWEDRKELSESEENNCLFYRALLGLTERFEFLLENPPEKKDKMIVTVKSNSGIERIPSPIQFKVIDQIIYLVGNDIPSEVLDKEFSFFVTIQGDETWKNDKIDKNLLTPSKFSLKEFMDYAMKNNTNGASLGYNLVK
jgi:hypothetical protein